ncbi:DUF930 domain-containing protein [uncultured Agrobacterium sp.]|uniref:DUF930 domain-containing protein n=1 Tax=uncultured Agrobacterium sp. TaxID=157277 RepID=UPI0025F1F808|nr:DUF930 domain-containing protein [uncultured Agrobacterium sp.]
MPMERRSKQNMQQVMWVVLASVLMHGLLLVTLYRYGNYQISTSSEPESVSVELVEPPKEKPPPEEKKAEETKEAEEAKKPEPPTPPQESPRASSLPSVAIRPDKTQLDARDEPGEQTDEGGQEKPQPTEAVDAGAENAQSNIENSQENSQSSQMPEKLDVTGMPANAAVGEILASDKPSAQDQVATAIPLPRPETEDRKSGQAQAPTSGEGNPQLKPVKKILASGKRPRPMLRQIMGKLPPQKRVEQLCVAETMAQIGRSRGPYVGLQPHTLKNYPISGNVMDAKGAFYTGAQWISVYYRCVVDIDKYIVTDFRFLIGDPLTSDDVKLLKLPGG